MLDYTVKEKKLLQCEAICENLETTQKELKYGNGNDHYYVHHTIAMTIVFIQSNSSK
jgi:hypothetical protein